MTLHASRMATGPGEDRPDRTARAGRTGRIGIVGGTFDPIHIGHLAIGELAREALGLDEVWYLPAREPVLRAVRPQASIADRLAMVELAIADNPHFDVCTAEVERPGPTYSVDTLEALVADGEAIGIEPDFTFILSAEAYAVLPAWRSPARLIELCRLAVVPRAGAAPADPAAVDRLVPGAAARTIVLDGPTLDISGSSIRARLAAGRSIRYLVPEAVIAYISDHHLYA